LPLLPLLPPPKALPLETGCEGLGLLANAAKADLGRRRTSRLSFSRKKVARVGSSRVCVLWLPPSFFFEKERRRPTSRLVFTPLPFTTLRDKMEPSMSRQPSIGSASFASQLDAHNKDTAAGLVSNAPMDMLEIESQARVDSLSRVSAAGLFPVPQATQDIDTDDVDTGFDDGHVDKLSEAYPTLNSKSYRQKDLYAERHLLLEKAKEDPFEQLESMASGIEAQDEGETKANDVATFNTIVPMFSAARETPGLRDFLAKLFGSLDAYYKSKERRAEIDNELAILADLYNTQEMEAEMERLKARQEARKAALLTKGKAKADKAMEKEAKKQRTE